MLAPHRIIFPCLFIFIGTILLLLGCLHLGFGGQAPSRSLNLTANDGKFTLGKKLEFAGRPVEQRCSEHVDFPPSMPDGFDKKNNWEKYQDHWQCIWDYEDALLIRYTIMGALTCGAAQLSCCLGGLHFFIDYRKN